MKRIEITVTPDGRSRVETHGFSGSDCRLFVVIEHERPDRAQLEAIARGIATEEGELPGGNELVQVLDAAAGLKLPPEFTRAERFDGVFFLDLPGREQKDAIWGLYLELFGLDPQQRRPADEQWTGAEIRSCCRLAALLDLPLVQAAQNVVPVAVTSGESVERLRRWASGRCLSADSPGVYRHDGGAPTGDSQSSVSPRRKVNRSPSVN